MQYAIANRQWSIVNGQSSMVNHQWSIANGQSSIVNGQSSIIKSPILPGMQITIRRAVLADAVTLSAISRQTFYDTFTGTCTEEDMQSFLELYFNLQQVKSELKNEDDFYYLAEAAGRVVGYLRFMEDYANFPVMKQWKSLELKRIYVSKEFQGKGVAQELMDFTLGFAKENNFLVVWLGVWEYNLRAQKFYEKYGFINSGHTHDFPIGNTPQTDWWYWKFLTMPDD